MVVKPLPAGVKAPVRCQLNTDSVEEQMESRQLSGNLTVMSNQIND